MGEEQGQGGRKLPNTYIEDIAVALANNHAALMLGAGFSKNADKLVATDREFLDWNELSDLFYDGVNNDQTETGKRYCSSLRLAQEVEVISGRPRLEELLNMAVPDQDYGPSDLYVKLMELPWADVFTTNYDTLLERAADMVTSRRYNVVVTQEDLVNSGGSPRIVTWHISVPQAVYHYGRRLPGLSNEVRSICEYGAAVIAGERLLYAWLFVRRPQLCQMDWLDT